MAKPGHRLEKIGQALILLGIVNFIAHALGFIAIGGSALQNGKVEDSRYYVSWYGSYPGTGAITRYHAGRGTTAGFT